MERGGDPRDSSSDSQRQFRSSIYSRRLGRPDVGKRKAGFRGSGCRARARRAAPGHRGNARRRRRANAAFEEFLKGFGESPRAAAPPPPVAPHPRSLRPRRTVAAMHADEPSGPPGTDWQRSHRLRRQPSPFAGDAAEAAGYVAPRRFRRRRAIDGKPAAHVNPRGPGAARLSPVRRAVPLIGIAVLCLRVLVVTGGPPGGARSDRSRGRPSGPAAPAPAPSTTPAATSVHLQRHPLVRKSRRAGAVWMRVTVDGQRVVEREVPEGTRIPLNGSQIVIRAGDAGAVRCRSRERIRECLDRRARRRRAPLP